MLGPVIPPGIPKALPIVIERVAPRDPQAEEAETATWPPVNPGPDEAVMAFVPSPDKMVIPAGTVQL